MDVSITKGVDIRKEDTLQELTRIINDFKSKKVYRALLTQTGVAAPTATVLENTLGGIVVWTYTGVGQYTGTLTGAFPDQNKVFFRQLPIWEGGENLTLSLFGIGWNDANSIYLRSMDGRAGAGFGTAANGLLNVTSIEIIVYV